MDAWHHLVARLQSAICDKKTPLYAYREARSNSGGAVASDWRRS